MTSLTMYGACTLKDVPAVKGLPNGLLLKGLLGKKWWNGLARWFKSPIPTDLGLNGETIAIATIYYCKVIPRCQDSCCTGESRFPGPKRSTHHRPTVPSRR